MTSVKENGTKSHGVSIALGEGHYCVVSFTYVFEALYIYGCRVTFTVEKRMKNNVTLKRFVFVSTSRVSHSRTYKFY